MWRSWAAYRALVAAAQQDEAVAELVASKDVLGDSAKVLLQRMAGRNGLPMPIDQAAARLVGPTFFWISSGRDPALLVSRDVADAFARELRSARRRHSASP